jgi:hypothetical protein
MAVGTDCFNARQNPVQYGDQAGALDQHGYTMAVAFHKNQKAEVTLSDTAGSLTGVGGKPGQGYPAVMQPIGTDCFNARQDPVQYGDQAGALDQDGYTMAVAFHENQRAEVTLSDTAGSLTGGGGKPGQGYPAVMQQIAFSVAPDHCGGDKSGQEVAYVNIVDVSRTLDCTGADVNRKQGGIGIANVAPTITAANDPSRSPQSSEVTQQVGAVHSALMQVRRLTPVECERLQGFPDGYTDIRPRGKDTPDGPRYKALGNSMAVPVMRWIGERIAKVDQA